MFRLLNSKIVLSINSMATELCFNTTRLATNASSKVEQCTHTTAFSVGGRGTKRNFSSVTKANVPSEPASNLHKLNGS